MSTLYREGFRDVEGMSGSLLFVRGLSRPAYGEIVAVESSSGVRRTGQILQVQEGVAVVQVFEGTMGLDARSLTVWVERDVLRVPVGEFLIGRVFDGRGRSLDGLPI
ncbi:MAG TPA: V-type ATP synthase subunit B, partial [Synergistaceae bacterium]|nr:V-type ATP synthase subunit B [Synergistaceae bacterium]